MDDSKRNIILSINANDLAIDAILMQDKWMFAYESHKLKFVQFDNLIHEKELPAVVHVLRVWRH